MLRDVEGRDLKDVAGLMGIGKDTAKLRLYRARRSLRAWDAVRRHPVPALGAVAAGIGAYALLGRIEGRILARARRNRGRRHRPTS